MIRPRRISIWPLALAFLFMTLALPGCGGCWRQAAQTQADKEKEKKEKEEKEKKDKEKRKPDFEFQDDQKKGLVVLPGDETNGVKPGHWMSISQPVKANNYDFHGELVSATVDNGGRALQLEDTAYRLEMAAPAALPKGQLKHLEMNVFVPRRAERGGTRPNLLARLNSRGGGMVQEFTEPTTTMEPYQYYFIVLSRTTNYGYLKVMDSIRPPRGDFGGPFMHYRVVAPQLDKRVPLPSNPLMWTSIAYLLWDDIEPDLLTLDQQDAMVDWLHWGGQLIISGPGSLETLKTSFLARHLPAFAGETEKLPQERWAELNRFTLPGAKGVKSELTVIPEKPPEGVVLKVREGGEFMPGTGDLLAQSRIGLGRIVVTSFSLTNPQIVNWKNFDGFFNACILHRPGRQFIGNRDLELVGVRFTGSGWGVADKAHSIDLTNDPRLTTKVRYFTRDAGETNSLVNGAPILPKSASAEDQFQQDRLAATLAGAAEIWSLDKPPSFDRGNWSAAQSGMAGWNDRSGVSNAARGALNDSADITVPQREFVFKVLAIYLLVLVPVNWGFFRLIGRVEWAWVAAPIIAICGAVAVVRVAQLDIGFARSRTEVAVLELQGDHSRGHLTRYMELYTSLSTRYDADFAQPSALAQPFGDPNYDLQKQPTVSTVTFARDSDVRLRGFKVESSTTRMLHTEEMRGIGGAIELKSELRGLVVSNNSDVALKDVGVIRRQPAGSVAGAAAIEVAWIGVLPAKGNATLKFGPITDARALLAEWENSPITTTNTPDDEVSLVRLLDIARDPQRLTPGDMKLIGWTDEDPGGVTLSPRPSNRTFRMLVIANLQYGDLRPPARDVNTLAAEKSRLNILDRPEEIDTFGN